ncbi:MAG: hypothetical protein HGN29_11585 [Asgard group archaeon]|nr:hypothetical protein [Asgard group archaeon]
MVSVVFLGLSLLINKIVISKLGIEPVLDFGGGYLDISFYLVVILPFYSIISTLFIMLYLNIFKKNNLLFIHYFQEKRKKEQQNIEKSIQVYLGILAGIILLDPIWFLYYSRKEILIVRKDEVDWKDLAQRLQKSLSEKQILKTDYLEKKSSSTIIIDSRQQLNHDFLEKNQKFIKELQEISLIGILCLLFLTQHHPSFSSVRIINRTLQIPVSSTYRILQKLVGMNLVTDYIITKQPNKMFYGITEKGDTIVLKLYELLGESIL